MGYTIIIGEMDIEYDQDLNRPYTFISAKEKRLENAPAFGEPTDYTNQRWPSYSSWEMFAKFVGLEDLFFDKMNVLCLIKSRPGYTPLTITHKKIVDEVYDKFKKKYPNVKAKFDASDENRWFCRLVWLKFWIDWALVNCERPVFYNG